MGRLMYQEGVGVCGWMWVQHCCVLGQLEQQEVQRLPGMTGSQAAGSDDVLLVCLRPSTGQAGPHRCRIVVPAPCVCVCVCCAQAGKAP